MSIIGADRLGLNAKSFLLSDAVDTVAAAQAAGTQPEAGLVVALTILPQSVKNLTLAQVVATALSNPANLDAVAAGDLSAPIKRYYLREVLATIAGNVPAGAIPNAQGGYVMNDALGYVLLA